MGAPVSNMCSKTYDISMHDSEQKGRCSYTIMYIQVLPCLVQSVEK